jgi:hypothetical protein
MLPALTGLTIRRNKLIQKRLYQFACNGPGMGGSEAHRSRVDATNRGPHEQVFVRGVEPSGRGDPLTR